MFHPFKSMPKRVFARGAPHGLNMDFTGLTWIKRIALVAKVVRVSSIACPTLSPNAAPFGPVPKNS